MVGWVFQTQLENGLQFTEKKEKDQVSFSLIGRKQSSNGSLKVHYQCWAWTRWVILPKRSQKPVVSRIKKTTYNDYWSAQSPAGCKEHHYGLDYKTRRYIKTQVYAVSF